EEDEHRRQDGRLDHPEQEAVYEEQPEPGDDPLGRGEDAPQNQTPGDQTLHAPVLGVVGGRDLEEEVSQEEKRPEERVRARGYPEISRESAGGPDGIVRAVQIGKAVG